MMISIIVPVYNNSTTITELTERIHNVLDHESYEIIFINDGSRDTSLQVLRNIAKEYTQVNVISFSRNFGQHSAICAGFEHAKGDVIVLMDADLQDRPENIPQLLEHLANEVDVVYSIKKESEQSIVTKITSRFYHYIFSKIVNVNVPRNIGTFRAFNRKVLNALLKYEEVDILYGPLMFYVGYKCRFVEVDRDLRSDGDSSYTFQKRLILALRSLITYTNVPYVIFSILGTALLVFSLLYGVIVFLQYLFIGKQLPAGLTLIVVYLSFLTGSLMLFLGILGAYIYRIFQQVLRRPRYLVDEIIDNR